MNESDILEVRIMALLKKSNLSPRRRVLLLIAAVLLLALPCVAAARFGVSFDTSKQLPQTEANGQQPRKTERAQVEKAVADLEAQAEKLKQRLEQTPQTKQDERAALEARLNEVQQNLDEHRKNLEEFQLMTRNAEMEKDADMAKLEKLLVQFENHRPANDADVKEMEQLLAQAKTKSPADLEAIRQMMEEIAAKQAAEQGDRKARLLSHTEAKYPEDARAKGIEGTVVVRFTVDHDGIPQNIQVTKSLYPSLDQSAIEAVRTWRFEPALKNGQPVSMVLESALDFSMSETKFQEAKETQERREMEKRGLVPTMTDEGQQLKVRRNDEAARRAERDAEEKRNAILASLARITMDHAIQIATSKAPGKVIECSLVGEHWEGPTELAKPSLVLYHVIVLSEDETPVRTHVLINAADGSVVRVSKEKREEEEPGDWAIISLGGATRKVRTVDGGVLNVKAANLPAPRYPDVARQTHASGQVNVRVVVDESGKVIDAIPLSGDPLLRAAAAAAAREAKFAPTRVNNEPAVVSGVLVYNFVAQ